jgi:hypothetical protein
MAQLPFSMEGVDYSEYQGARLAYRVRARQVLVAPRAFGPFQLANAHELVLNDVQVDVYLDEACERGAACGDAVLDDPSLRVLRIARMKGGPPVAGATLFDVSWVLWRGSSAVARFSAKRAGVSRRGATLDLRDARLEDIPTSRVLFARQAVWDPPSRTFTLRGGYVLHGKKGRSTVKSMRMDLGRP